MNELTLDGKVYVSSKRAAEITGYAKDYVGQLCREGRVEARLVGRNWYILESALREHRFGAQAGPQEGETKATTESYGWSEAKYGPDQAPEIPTLQDRSMVNKLYDTSVGQNSAQDSSLEQEPSSILTTMQSAWQEWYANKSESPEAVESVAIEEIEEPEEQPIIEPDPLPVAVVMERAEEEPVTYIIEPDPETTLDLSHSEPLQAAYIEEEPVGIIVEETIHEAPARAQVSLFQGVVARSALIAVMLIVITITVIGTGFAGRFSLTGLSRYSEIQFLAGTSVYNHK